MRVIISMLKVMHQQWAGEYVESLVNVTVNSVAVHFVKYMRGRLRHETRQICDTNNTTVISSPARLPRNLRELLSFSQMYLSMRERPLYSTGVVLGNLKAPSLGATRGLKFSHFACASWYWILNCFNMVPVKMTATVELGEGGERGEEFFSVLACCYYYTFLWIYLIEL